MAIRSFLSPYSAAYSSPINHIRVQMKFPCGKGSNLVPFPRINQDCQPMTQQELAEKPYCLGEAPRDYYVIYQLLEGSIGLERKMAGVLTFFSVLKDLLGLNYKKRKAEVQDFLK
ncbi:hypothetical protein NC653_033950 [Populus alba x Populus x berolinensis]|uniref:Uncharacterized protein n=1 Tax=Populus alba x Populus x berolinensis TaxID=444605 RepID=A0AAD6Q0Z9_9ROSI|nr:hypothetical protein NC653_033950 [Populus alba x Populus x berolinensis]